MVQLDPSHRNTPSDMSGIYLRGRGGQLVQLGALAKVEAGVGPRQINHFNRVPSFTLSASLIPPFAQGEALDSLDRLARQVLPPGSTTALAGDSREFKESGGALYFAFGVALQIGRASCRERVEISGVAVSLKKKKRGSTRRHNSQ